MGVSRASVSEHVKRLIADGLLAATDGAPVHRGGPRHARSSLVRRHRLAEHFLIDVIGLPWHKAHEEAERWERVISDEVEERLVVILDDPATCLHGNPIPGSSHETDCLDPGGAQGRGARVQGRRCAGSPRTSNSSST